MSVDHALNFTVSDKQRLFVGYPPPMVSPNGHYGSNGPAYVYSQEESRPFSEAAILALTELYARDVGKDPETSPAQGEHDIQSLHRSARLPSEMQHRRLDLAVSVEFELLTVTADLESSLIISIITGSPTMSASLRQTGVGEVLSISPSQEAKTTALEKLYEKLGTKDGERHIVLDFLMFGVTQSSHVQIFLRPSSDRAVLWCINLPIISNLEAL